MPHRPVARIGPRRSCAIITSGSTAKVIPDGLAGDQIPLLARIVSVVDVFDALTTDRPYRKAMKIEAAYRIMRDDAAAGWCDSILVESFIDLHRAGPLPTCDRSAAATLDASLAVTAL